MVTVKNTVVLDVIPSTLVETGRCFGEMQCRTLQGTKDKCKMLLRNVDQLLSHSKTSRLRRRYSCNITCSTFLFYFFISFTSEFYLAPFLQSLSSTFSSVSSFFTFLVFLLISNTNPSCQSYFR